MSTLLWQITYILIIIAFPCCRVRIWWSVLLLSMAVVLSISHYYIILIANIGIIIIMILTIIVDITIVNLSIIIILLWLQMLVLFSLLWQITYIGIIIAFPCCHVRILLPLLLLSLISVSLSMSHHCINLIILVLLTLLWLKTYILNIIAFPCCHVCILLPLLLL